MKKIIVTMIAIIIMVFVGVNVADAKTTTTLTTTNSKSSWKINKKVSQKCLTKEEKKSFNKAIKKYKSTKNSFKPIAVLGSSIAAGPKDTYLCLGTKKDKANFYFITVYNQVSKKGFAPRVLTIKKLNLNNYIMIKDSEVSPSPNENENIFVPAPETRIDYPICGGFQVNARLKPGKLDKNVKTAFDNAVKSFEPVNLKPITLLRSRNNNGKDYTILCFGTKNYTEDAHICLYDPSIYIITIHQTKDGESKLQKIHALAVQAYR